MTDKRLTVGSWSSGSTRTEDWAAAALDMAASVGLIGSGNGHIEDGHARDDQSWLGEYLDHDSDACEADDCEYCDEQIAADVLDSLISTLEEYAPIYCYVGAAEGDGADFGVWLSQDALDEAIRTSVETAGLGLINVQDCTIIDVSDHGNVEVYAIARGESLLSLV